jgi:predicted phage terminase large subunit-like protein
MTKPTPRSILDPLLRTSLTAFIERAFYTLNPGQTFLCDHHVRVMAYHLELVERRELQRLAIALPPRHLKSHCASVAFSAWVLGRDPTKRIIAASYSADLAQGFSLLTRKVMAQEWYREIFPGTMFDPKRTTLEEIRTTLNGFRIATSVGGPLTGKGGNIVILDDPLKAGESCSEAARKSARDWFRTTLLSRLDNPKRDAIVLVTQRLHVDDLFGLVIEQGGWTTLELPAIATKNQEIPVADGKVWMRPAGDILQPERVGKAELEQLRKDLGSANFEAQYQQQPHPPKGNLVQLEWFERYDEPLQRDRYEAVFQSWDTAMVPGEGNDYSVCTTWGILGTRFYLLDVFREQLNYPDLRREVIRLQDESQATIVVVEAAGSGIPLYQDLHETRETWLFNIHPEGDKVSRLAHQSAKIEEGMVYLPKTAPWLAAFESEVAVFPNGKHDDQVDSMTQFLRALDHRPLPLLSLSLYAGC